MRWRSHSARALYWARFTVLVNASSFSNLLYVGQVAERWRSKYDSLSFPLPTLLPSMQTMNPPSAEDGKAGTLDRRPKIRVKRFLKRSLTYLLKERSSPLQLGAGVALGTLIGMTPFYGLHLVLALALAAPLRVNIAGAALATQISNPFLAPFLVFASMRIGAWLGFGGAGTEGGVAASSAHLLEAWLAGGLVLGVVCGLVLGLIAGGLRALMLGRPRAVAK